MVDEHGKPVKEATPSTPVQVLGLSAVPEAGDEFVVVKNEREAKDLVEHRIAAGRRAGGSAGGDTAAAMSAETLFASLDGDEERELCIVLKADVGGTLEAARDGILQLSTDKVKTKVVLAGVGAVSESDVMLAATAGAVVYGFHIRPDSVARKTSEREGVPVRTFDVIYEMLDDVRGAMEGMLPPRQVEVISGHAEVRQLFVIPRQGTVAGSFVPEGVIRRENQIRVLRDGVPVYSGKLASLRHFKDDVREVQSGSECGMRIENFDDVKVGDVLESFMIEEHAETL
jgi:translation initiation factor IF-2